MIFEEKQTKLDFYELIIKNTLPFPVVILHAFIGLLIHFDAVKYRTYSQIRDLEPILRNDTHPFHSGFKLSGPFVFMLGGYTKPLARS